MSEFEALKASIKKLSARATQAKMDLHDLSEDLPVDWERIPAQAEATYQAYAALIAARARLKAAEG